MPAGFYTQSRDLTVIYPQSVRAIENGDAWTSDGYAASRWYYDSGTWVHQGEQAVVWAFDTPMVPTAEYAVALWSRTIEVDMRAYAIEASTDFVNAGWSVAANWQYDYSVITDPFDLDTLSWSGWEALSTLDSPGYVRGSAETSEDWDATSQVTLDLLARELGRQSSLLLGESSHMHPDAALPEAIYGLALQVAQDWSSPYGSPTTHSTRRILFGTAAPEQQCAILI